MGGSDSRTPYLGAEDKLLKESIRSAANSYWGTKKYIDESGMGDRTRESYWRRIGSEVFASKSLSTNLQASQEIDRINALIAARGLSGSGIGAKAAGGISAQALGQIGQYAGEMESYVDSQTMAGQNEMFQAMAQLQGLERNFIEAQRARATRMAEWDYSGGYFLKDENVARLNKALGVKY